MLTSERIKGKIQDGSLVIYPYSEGQLNPNSYDLCLTDRISYYKDGYTIDPREPGDKGLITEFLPDPSEKRGFLLSPKVGFYLVTTQEVTYTPDVIPLIFAKSSMARMGIDITLNAGFGDLGYRGRWTLGLQVTRPTYIYAGMPVVQIAFFEPHGVLGPLYGDLDKSKYQADTFDDVTPNPIPHKYHKNSIFNKIK